MPERHKARIGELLEELLTAGETELRVTISTAMSGVFSSTNVDQAACGFGLRTGDLTFPASVTFAARSGTATSR